MTQCSVALPDTKFNKGSCPYLTYGNFSQCILHLPSPQKSAHSLEFVTFISQLINNDPSIFALPHAATSYDFRGAIIPSSIEISKYFPPDGNRIPFDFSRTQFEGVSSFSNCIFVQPVLFSDCQFHGTSKFENIDFGNETLFIGCYFLDTSEFINTFDGHVKFHKCSWQRGALFTKAIFKNDIEFCGSEFKRIANFSYAQFKKVANFKPFEQKEPTRFWQLDLSHATFAGPVFLESCAFDETTIFDHVQFLSTGTDKHDPVSLNGSRFIGDLSFQNARICRRAQFNGATFDKSAFFQGSHFWKVPSITSVNFNGDTSFESCSFDEGDEVSYRKLKRLMDDQSHYWEATLFYGRELDEQRINLRKKPEKSFNEWIDYYQNTAYKKLNDYGRSWLLPLIWLIGSWFVFGVIYWLGNAVVLGEYGPLVGWQRNALFWGDWRYGLFFSFQNVKLSWLLGREILFARTPCWWFFAGIQSLFSVILIAMIILSLRRRFKIH